MRFFLWFSFLYFTTPSKSDIQNRNDANDYQLSNYQEQQLYNELSSLSEQRRRDLLQDLEIQAKDFEQSKLKWAKLRQTLPYSEEFSKVSQQEIDTIQRKIRSGGNPVVRNKRTLKFLVKSLTEILGLRWTLLKYSLIPAAVNTFIGPPPPAAPASPAAPANPPPKPAQPPAPPPKRPPPAPPRPPPAKPAAPPARPPAPPAAPPPAAPAAPPARPPPPTIPPNQIDANTIRYPFRPAPTISFLAFAPLPPGVTVPYPPLFQWPAPAASPAPPMPPQPPCAAPPPAPPKNSPRTPSILPLPKPRAPVPPPPKPVAPILPASPGKTPLKLEYDHPVRIEIFNNVKPHLPVSGSVYSGEPSLTSLEEQDERENEYFLNPTQAINSIEENYNTEPAQPYNVDYDYGFHKGEPVSYHNSDIQTTENSLYSDNRESTEAVSYDEDLDLLRGNTERNRYEHYDDREEDDESTTKNHHNDFSDYPERELAEENRAHVNIKVKHYPRKDVTQAPNYNSQKIRKHPKKPVSSKTIRRKPSSWKVKSKSNNFKRDFPSTTEAKLNEWTTTDVPTRVPKISRRLPRPARQNFKLQTTKNPEDKFSYNIVSWGEDFSSSSYSPPVNPSNPFNKYNYSNKPSNEFRIVVPNDPSRRRRDIFFDDAFKSFNLSNFETFNETDAPESTQAQFLESNGKLVPNLDYRKQLEKDIEKYVEQYVEQQISNGEIDTKKPKTTIVELKSKDGVPIKTITTTISKLVDGSKPLLESILDFSQNINPVSNVAEIAGESSPPQEASTSEVSKAFQDNPNSFSDSFSWNFSN